MTSTLLPDTASTIGSWARFIARGLQASGVDSQQAFLDAGIDLAGCDNPNQRFPVENMSRVWRAATELTGDPCFPLTLAEQANPSMYNALGLSMISSPTLGAALNRACRFSQVASDAAQVVQREISGGKIDMVYQMTPEQRAAITPEALVAFMATSVNILRQVSGDRFDLDEVHFGHDHQQYVERYQAFFRANIVFNAPEYKIRFDRKVLELHCDQGNAELAANIDNWMSEYLSRFEQDSLARKVRELLAGMLPDGEFSQEAIASQLAMSTRSLQRGLQKESCSFKELLELTRQDLALKYISEPRLSLIEICCLLGFSDQSNFTKAFKRWTGKTPNAYRQQLAA